MPDLPTDIAQGSVVGGRLLTILRRILHKVRVLPRVRLRQWVALGRAWRMMFRVRTKLWRHSFAEVRAWVGVILSAPPSSPLGRCSPRLILWAVDRAAWFLPGTSTCLHRALTARILLAQQGWDAELHIGGRHDTEGVFEAHAWLEYEGHVILGSLPALDTYKRFEGFIL